jgi:hypothetical protein
LHVCRKHTALFETLFTYLAYDDPQVMNIFWSWITQRPLQEVQG